MERELQANDHKSGRQGIPLGYLLLLLRQEVEELAKAIANGGAVVSEAADVANFCMMIVENARELWREKQDE